jgi:DUF4097 and DUF4098 domain-containing protein YvlB
MDLCASSEEKEDMKIRFGLNLAILISMILGSSFIFADRADTTQSESFTVKKGDNLEVSISTGDIRVVAWDKNQVTVNALGVDEEFGGLMADQAGDAVEVRTRGDLVRLEVSAPTQINMDLRTSAGDIDLRGPFSGLLQGSTSGGDVKMGNVSGKVTMRTSGGDIVATAIEGDATLKTSGGDISLNKCTGDLDTNTSGGDIAIGYTGKSVKASTGGGSIDIGDVGGSATISTGGGDITIKSVSGSADLVTGGGSIELSHASGRVLAKTGGGDITLTDITGSVDAKTGGGSIEASLIPSGIGASRLLSSGGDLVLSLPETAKATVEARIRIRGRWDMNEDYEIISDFRSQNYTKDQEEKEIRAIYVLNGGGEKITLETVNGSIEIRKLLRKSLKNY